MIELRGPTTVEVGLGELADSDGDGLEQVPTEMVQLELTGTSPTLGTVMLHLSPTMPTRGEIEEQANATPGTLDLPPFEPVGTADSFFDVFFEVEVASRTDLGPPARR